MMHDPVSRSARTSWTDEPGGLIDRVPPARRRAPAEPLPPRGDRPRPAAIGDDPLFDEQLAAEWRRTLAVLAAAIVTGTAIATLVDAAGTAAIVADLIRWWLL